MRPSVWLSLIDAYRVAQEVRLVQRQATRDAVGQRWTSRAGGAMLYVSIRTFVRAFLSSLGLFPGKKEKFSFLFLFSRYAAWRLPFRYTHTHTHVYVYVLRCVFESAIVAGQGLHPCHKVPICPRQKKHGRYLAGHAFFVSSSLEGDGIYQGPPFEWLFDDADAMDGPIQ